MSRFGKCLVALTLACLVAGCNGASARKNGADGPISSLRNKETAIRGNNAFALSLYAQLRSRQENLIFSPFTIRTCLGMIYGGARGQTADIMAAGLRFKLPQDELHPALGALLHDLNLQGKRQGYQLQVINDMWIQRGHDLLADFVELTQRNYGVAPRQLNFADDAFRSRRTINARVESETRGGVKRFLKSGALDASSLLVLTNVISFKADWNKKFKKEETALAPFLTRDGAKARVPLMHQTGVCGHFDGGTFQALELPYQSEELSMVVLLPSKADGLAALEETMLTASELPGILSKLQAREVEVFLPKFNLTAQLNLKNDLTMLGLGHIFSGIADFSGLDGRQDLFLSAVVHQASLEVGEEGGEPAAGSGTVIAKSEPGRLPVFRADHPFIFLIRDRGPGNVLFLGRFTVPAPGPEV